MSPLAELLRECDARGIRLLAADGGALTVDAPKTALTPDLLALLKAQKVGLLRLLRSRRLDEALAAPLTAQEGETKPTKPICRCGSTTWRDVPIHGGQSVRRDCRRCGRFVDFPVWYGGDTGHNGQHSGMIPAWRKNYPRD
jgi:hypothetical protein